jgi:hypothetical protein
MATVYTNKAQKSTKGVIFAPGKDERTGKYFIFKLCENYDGRVRGGIRKSWCVVKQSEKGLSLDEAKEIFEKRLGKKLYS